MGGLISLSLGSRNPDLKIAGFIASAPLLGNANNKEMDKVKVASVKILGNAVGVKFIYIYL